MITCRELIEFLDDYVAGALPSDRRRAFEEHLALCPDCVNYLESYRLTIDLGRKALLDDEALATVPEGLVRAILASRDTI